MNLKLVEPLKYLFKDEVRKLGNELNLPKTFINRHPFPGPGLAIRCPGEVTIKKVKILQNIDEIFIDQIKKYNLYDEIWQAFSVLLPTRSVGVMGDKRTYDYACVLRAVTSVDGMTADYFNFPKKFLDNKNNFSEDDWLEMHKLSIKTYVEESEVSKTRTAGAGLTDND